jgi:hypothetical protein
MLHSGRPEVPGLPESRLEHIQASGHFAGTLSEAIGARTFGMVIAT